MLLNRLLGEVLEEQEGHELHQLARRLGTQQDRDSDRLFQRIPELQQPQLVQRLLRAFTILFQLLNVAEQKEIIRINRERQAGTSSPRPESIREGVLRLKKSGLSAARVQELLSQIDICPTLTAHPTEVRRRAVQDKLQTVAKWLVEYHQPAWLELPLGDAGLAEQELLRTLTALWQTDELHPNPPTVDDEVQNVLYFFEHTILNRVTWLHHDLRAALHRHLEQITHAVLIATATAPRRPRALTRWQEVMEELAERSREAYCALVYEDPEFWRFYTQATPIVHISQLPVGSRPATRPGA